MKLETGILIFGIILFALGQFLSRKYEKRTPNKNHYSGAFFQLDTQLIVNGFILIVISLYIIFIQ